MFYMNTRANYERFMHWHILCSLVEDCIAPTHQFMCSFDRELFKVRINVTCHRYDMASLNLLLSNYHEFDITRFALLDGRQILTVKRADSQIENVEEYKRRVLGT